MVYETPARLHVVLARRASIAVILRRGPSRLVRAILWHTDTDKFENGQWLKGRVYAEKCALSPNGSLFLYFAAQHHKSQNGYLGTWTAISKPPYFTALGLWPIGDTWGGGGMFIDDHTIWLNGCHLGKAHPDHQPSKDFRIITTTDELTKRDQEAIEKINARSWQLVYRPANKADIHPYNRLSNDPPIWHRDNPANDRYYLIQRHYGYLPQHYPEPTVLEFAIGDRKSNTEIAIGGANWADWDQQGRLIYVRDGQVFAQNADQVESFTRPLADFNDQTFEEVPPPYWAMRW